MQNRLWRQLYCLLLTFSCLICTAQISSIDPHWKDRYRREVKSLDEFEARFNLMESHPDVEPDSMSDYANIYALFDFERIFGKADETSTLEKIHGFCDSVFDHHIRFSMENGGVFVQVKCVVEYRNKKGLICIYFRPDKTEKGYDRWSIIAVTGLEKSGLLDLTKTYALSPTEHEMHFMRLDDSLNENPLRSFGYRNSGLTLDQTSIFLALVHSGKLKFQSVKDMTVYCFDVPGYMFTVNECVRDSNNSGWLITSLNGMNDEDKINIINNLLKEK